MSGPKTSKNNGSRPSKKSGGPPSRSDLARSGKGSVTKKSKPPPPKQQKTKPAGIAKKKKRRVYTDKELGITPLNKITPVGVEKPRGKKKGKVFIDDQESMVTILALVNAEKEGQIESKMMKGRQMEEIRQARQQEAEAKAAQRKGKLEETKDSLRKGRKRTSKDRDDTGDINGATTARKPFKPRKKVSFA
ncbi:60S ribosomal subunit assembly/export protein [Agyrium rufum]|nr:60S ribosomal subunit assembly/export protein [Agyrium rufum]